MKKLYIFLVAILFVVTFACTDASAMQGDDPIEPVIFDSEDDPGPVETTPIPAVVEEQPDDPVAPDDAEPEPISEPQVPEVDPNEELTWKFLEVSEEWLKEVYGIGLKRDGHLYSISDIVSPGNWEETGMGYKNPDSEGFICSRGDKGDEWIIVDDRFIIPCVSGKDDLAFYGEPTPSIKLVPMGNPTYTVPIWQDTDVCKALTVFDGDKRSFKSYDDDLTMIYDYHSKSVQLFDSDGNDVFSDFRDLNYGDVYTLKWKDGEEELKAFWRYYKPTGDAAITLKGEATDDPEVTKYDFSSVPSGLYFIVESYTLIEVKND